MTVHFLLVLITLSLAPCLAWRCVELQQKTLQDGLTWKTQNCTMDESAPPLLTVNSIHLDLSRWGKDLRAIPAIANPTEQLQTLSDIARQDERFVAGINGGYFWRVDIDGIWVDNVCRGKTRKEAEQPASDVNVNYGIGDGTIKIDGIVYSNNCNCSGYSRPAVLKLEGETSFIDVLYRGEQVEDDADNAISAGPNLLSFDFTTQQSYVDIPDDDDNINRLVYEASSSVGLCLDKSHSKSSSTAKATELVMVATDGHDKCPLTSTDCGINAPNLAALLKEVFMLDIAMSLDQGGSTAMWVRGENPDRDGIVSRSSNDVPPEEEGGRHIANGLFIQSLV